LRFSAPLLLGYAPIVLLAIVSWAIKPLFTARYLTPSAPFIAIAAVAGWTTLRMRVQQVALAGTVALALVVFAGSDPHLDSDRAEDLKVAARQLSEHMQPGDVVVFEPAWMRMPLARYWRPGPDVDIAKPVPDLGYLDLDVTDAASRAKLNAAARVWIVGLGRDVPPPPIDAISVFRDDLAKRPVLSTDHIGEVEIRLLGPLPSGRSSSAGRHHPVDVSLDHHGVQRLIDAPARLGSLGGQLPLGSLGCEACCRRPGLPATVAGTRCAS